MPATSREKKGDKPKVRNAEQLVAGLLRFHELCANPRCRRAQACGDRSAPCFNRFWWDVPERDKVGMRALFTAMASGQTPRRAIDFSEREQQRFDALNAPREPIVPLDNAVAEADVAEAPRVRRL